MGQKRKLEKIYHLNFIPNGTGTAKAASVSERKAVEEGVFWDTEFQAHDQDIWASFKN